MEFKSFPKIPRLFREITITEKIDGTNASIYIADLIGEIDNLNPEVVVLSEQKIMKVGSRNRWLTKEQDNYGFFKWAVENKEYLLNLGPGHHFGEWWGQGIQRNYDLKERRFSLFNSHRWGLAKGEEYVKSFYELTRCHVVPILYQGELDLGEGHLFKPDVITNTLLHLERMGSQAAPGFMKPEGIILYHKAGDTLFKVTLENDGEPKTKNK